MFRTDVVGGCKFILILCVAAFSAAERKFTMNLNGTDLKFLIYYQYDTWQQARERCAGAGARLWVPGGEAEVGAVWWGELAERGYGGGAIWTGINDAINDGVYRDADGQPLGSLPLRWAANEPDSVGGKRRCVKLYQRALYLDDCDSTAIYVCKFLAANERTSSTGSFSFPPATIDNNDQLLLPSNHLVELEKPFAIKRYSADILSVFVYNAKQVTWYQAKEICSTAGAELMTPEDLAEAKAVMEWVGRINPRWGGMWTGINDLDSSGVYRILDGRLLNSTDLEWADPEPNSDGGLDRCVMVGWALLYVYNCGFVNPYVCRFRITPAPTAPTSQ